jgi:hypothetical protein
MNTSIPNRIHTYRAIMSDLILSAVGCFVLRRCFSFVAERGDDLAMNATGCSLGQARDPLAYAGAALILLALSANEQPALIGAASSQTHSGIEAGAVWKP